MSFEAATVDDTKGTNISALMRKFTASQSDTRGYKVRPFISLANI